jgi:cell division protein FtsN
MVAIAAAVLVAFIGGLYFITHHKKEEAEALQNRQAAGNGLPPKPEERWRYIKELESRQPGVRAPTEPTAGGEVMKPEQLTDEQRQLLAQMQADMRQQPTQLTEVPWNEQTPAQRQQTLQRQRLVQQQQQHRCSSRHRRRYSNREPSRASSSSQSRYSSRRSKPRRTSSRIRICCRRQRIPIPRSRKRSRRAGNSRGRSAENRRAEKKTIVAG